MKTDWYGLVRRVSLAAFILLAIWGVMQATEQLALAGAAPNYLGWIPTYFGWVPTLNQWCNVILWPLLGAPWWYRITYFTLGFWLILPYIGTMEFGR